MTMETVKNDANVKIEVPWEDDVLSNEIVANDFDDFKVKSEPVDNSVDDKSEALLTGNLFKNKEKNPNSINCLQEIIDIKDEFGHAMKDFDKIDKVVESEKWNYDSMHAHFILRIQKIDKLSSTESLIVANAMIKACKEAFPCLNSDLRAHYLSAIMESEGRKGNNNILPRCFFYDERSNIMVSVAKNAQEPWLLDLRQFIHSQLSEKVQDKLENLYTFCEIVDLIVSYFSV